MEEHKSGDDSSNSDDWSDDDDSDSDMSDASDNSGKHKKKNRQMNPKKNTIGLTKKMLEKQ